MTAALWRGALAAALLASGTMAAASGPYVVDDAAITPARHAQLEAWLSHASGSTIANLVPAVTLGSLPDVEWSVGLNGTRRRGIAEDRLTVQGKRQLRTGDGGRAGIAAAANIALDARSGRPAGGFAYGALTVPVGRRLLVHGNAGVGHEVAAPQPVTLAWGVRAEWAVVPDRAALHAEVFGTSATGTGYQLGFRPTLANGHLDLELVHGHNLTGEGEDWFTLGLAARF